MPEIAPAVRRFADKSLCGQSISPGLLQPADKKDHENLIGKRWLAGGYCVDLRGVNVMALLTQAIDVQRPDDEVASANTRRPNATQTPSRALSFPSTSRSG